MHRRVAAALSILSLAFVTACGTTARTDAPAGSPCAPSTARLTSPVQWRKVTIDAGREMFQGGAIRVLAARPGCPAVYVAIAWDGQVWRSEGGDAWTKGSR